MFVKLVKTLNGIIERMTPRQLLITAAVAGVVMCLLIYLTIRSFEEDVLAEQEEPVEMQEVVIATADIERGKTITADMLAVAAFAKKSVPRGSADDIRVFQGLPARVDILSGDILTEKKVYSDIRQAGFKGMIPPDCRAVTIPIDNITGVAGLISPGDYVDLLLITSSGTSLTGTGVKGEVLLQNVLLLSIDQNMNRLSGDIELEEPEEEKSALGEDVDDARKSAEQLADTAEKMHSQAKDTFAGEGFKAASQGRSMSGLGAAGKGDGGDTGSGTATLALKPDEVLKVATSLQAGTIQLALRPFKPAPTSMFIAETEYYTGSPAAPARAAQPTPRVTTNPTVPNYQLPRMSNAPVSAYPPIQAVIPPMSSKPDYEVIKWGQ